MSTPNASKVAKFLQSPHKVGSLMNARLNRAEFKKSVAQSLLRRPSLYSRQNGINDMAQQTSKATFSCAAVNEMEFGRKLHVSDPS